jgi:hypothetical protein
MQVVSSQQNLFFKQPLNTLKAFNLHTHRNPLIFIETAEPHQEHPGSLQVRTHLAAVSRDNSAVLHFLFTHKQQKSKLSTEPRTLQCGAVFSNHPTPMAKQLSLHRILGSKLF